MLKRFRLALSFLTILPGGTALEVKKEDLPRSAAFFPTVGWLLGISLSGWAFLLSTAGLSPFITAMLLLGFGAWLTRGLHLDGLADLLDGLGGGADPEKRLAIMKDSSLGVFGGVGLVIILGLKAACLTQIIADARLDSFFLIAAAPAAARWSMTALAYNSTYPRQAGTGHQFVGRIRKSDLFFGLLTLLPVLAAGFAEGLAVIMGSFVPALWLRRKCHNSLGGVTGDVLGASCELGEAFAWLAVSFLVVRF